jgi:ornithine carbamoyltransferase
MAYALESTGFDVPVINLLSDQAHPCQAVADVLTLREILGPLPGQVLAYIGDSNNMCRSLVKAGLMEGMDVRVASPPGYSFSAEEVTQLTALSGRVGRGGTLHVTDDPKVAAGGADALYTDVWTSMGQEEETGLRREAFAPYIIDDALLDVAEPDVAVLHCLPAHRGEEISESVLEGSHSVVWRQAAHRQTAMRGILAWAVESSGAES